MPVANPAQDYATVSAPPSVTPVTRTMRRFGIELEMQAGPTCTGDPRDTAVSLLRAAGINARTNYYSGRDYAVWQCKEDGSLRPVGRCLEVVSRILPGNESSYEEIRRAVDPLDNAGFGVNRTCGFHVHINVSDLPHRTRQLIVLRYAQLQPQINAMLPPSRRDNGYCPPMDRIGSDTNFRALCANIESGARDIPTPSHNSVTNCQHLSDSDSARIEFRQAAATCNAAKVIGWVRFLQEMVDDVATRARTANFGNAVPVAPPRPVLVPQTIGGRVPTMRNGSDADRALTQLCTHGVITAAWAREAGIGDNVLRRIIVGFRRHGAGIITQRDTGNGAAYILSGAHTLPVARSTVFAGATVNMSTNAPPAPVAPSIVRTVARDFIAYPFNAGLSDATIAWCNDRRDTFAASNEA